MPALLDLKSPVVSHKTQKARPIDLLTLSRNIALLLDFDYTVALHLNHCRQKNIVKYSKEEEKSLAVCYSNLLDHYSRHVLLHTLGWLDSKARLLNQLTVFAASAIHLNDEISYELT